MPQLTVLILLFVGCFISTPSLALGKLGHQLTCQLAYQQLSGEKKATLDNLLNTVQGNALSELNKYNYQRKNAPMTFAKACTWPDMVKNQPSYKKYKKWHFINVDRSDSHITLNSCKRDCVTNAIPFHLTQLKTATSNHKKLEAVMFLGHWVADIHQPLHVSYASDWGGNKTKVSSPDGKCTNMHWLWDQCLLTRQIKTNDHKKRYEFLFNTLQQRLDDSIQHGEITHWQSSSVVDWANESLQLSRSAQLNYCQMELGQCKAIDKQPIKLPSNYQATFGPIINTRIAQASVRLAVLLESSL